MHNDPMNIISSPHSTPPRLCTGDSMDLVCFCPSPTSRARREHQRWVSGARWWVGTPDSTRSGVQKRRTVGDHRGLDLYQPSLRFQAFGLGVCNWIGFEDAAKDEYL
jgi:hypothetical protein